MDSSSNSLQTRHLSQSGLFVFILHFAFFPIFVSKITFLFVLYASVRLCASLTAVIRVTESFQVFLLLEYLHCVSDNFEQNRAENRDWKFKCTCNAFAVFRNGMHNSYTSLISCSNERQSTPRYARGSFLPKYLSGAGDEFLVKVIGAAV